ncbi:MAG: putative Acyltransferase 3 [Myxococcaceae bacterium]|nr:putative Acyltransferase 3 [Myxococcaceae bacterium]
MSEKSKTAAPRYLFIDALRGIAALLVVGYHAREGHHLTALSKVLPRWLDALLEHGDTGVAMFFTISGFVIANTLIPQQVTPRYAGTFMLRRSLRLDPPYWASMLLCVALAALSAQVLHRPFDLPSAKIVLLHVLYLHELFHVQSIADVYWTLCLEIQFYLSFTLLMIAITKLSPRLGKERALDLLLWPAAAFANLWALQAAPFQVYGLFLGQWFMFMAGVLVWRAVVRAEQGDLWPAAVAALDLAVLGVGAAYFGDLSAGVGVLTAASVLALGLSRRLTTTLSARPFQFLGAISYSLYLIHSPLTGAGFRLGFMLTGRSAALEAFWLVLVLAGCIAGAWVFYRLIEKPSMSLAKRIGRSPTPAPIMERRPS